MNAQQIFSIGCRRLRLHAARFLNCLSHCSSEGDARRLLEALALERDVSGFAFELFWSNTLAEVEQLRRLNAKVTYPGAEDYPMRFLNLDCPPTYLSYVGDDVWTKQDWLAVVGSRDPSREALEWMELELPRVLDNPEFSFVSGAARGVDQKAHALCLRKSRPTIAALPSGLAMTYPREFREWYQRIVDGGGAIVSEYMPTDNMQKFHFLERNRLISAFGRSLLVVQARQRSGSLLTAGHARDQGRTIATVPWSAIDVRATGTNQLLFEGAQLVRTAEEIIGVLTQDQWSLPNPATVGRELVAPNIAQSKDHHHPNQSQFRTLD